MASKTLADLKEEFKTEPTKRKKIEGSMQQVPKWNLDSRNLMINLFYNQLKEKARASKGKLPSIDADALSKMNNPIAQELIEYRSMSTSLKGFLNVSRNIHPSIKYGFSDGGIRANIKFNVIGFDNIERIYPVAKESIPLSVDKRVRYSFVTPKDGMISEREIPAESLKILKTVEGK